MSNFKPEMDFYSTTSARLFPSSEITWKVACLQPEISFKGKPEIFRFKFSGGRSAT
jgi:hypothetical protein